MRIATRVWLGLVVAIVMVLVGGVAVRVRQEREILLEVTLRDRRFFAHALDAAVEGRADPLAEATLILAREEVAEAHIDARLVSLTGARGLPRPTVPASEAGALAHGAVVVTVHDAEILTYVPLGSADQLAIELSEPRAVDALLSRIRWVSLLTQTALLVGFAAIVTFALVRWLVGRPLGRLAVLARRIAAGDLAARTVVVTGDDEVSVLAGEMNRMAEHLEATRRALEEADAARVAALEELRHADRLRTVGQLASALAHELGTPLNVVSGHARIIDELDLSPDAKASARTILEQAGRMTRIIRNVLDYARRKGPQPNRRDLVALARHAAETLAPLTKRERVVIEVSPDAPVLEARVDPQQVLQVLTNLLVNAMQSMPKGGRIQVLLGCTHAKPPAGVPEAEGTYARVSVVDEGSGIDAADLPHLFQPFYTRKSEGEGTGLGLAVVEGIVQDHHGWVEVASQVGRGSRFDVYLPLTP